MVSFEVEAYNCTCNRQDHLLEKPRTLQIAVQVSCVLSVLGSFMVIFSYLCYKEHRTQARYILVHLSLSNIGHVISNLIGVSVNLDGHAKNSCDFHYNIYCTNRSTQEVMCTIQAFTTIYFSLSAMLWTIFLAIYLYLLILSMRQTQLTRCIVWLGYLSCYLIPVLVTCWLLLTNRLGYAPYNYPGYCGLVTRKPFQRMYDFQRMYNQCDPIREVYVEFFGYDIWILLTILLTILFYVSALRYLRSRQEVREECTKCESDTMFCPFCGSHGEKIMPSCLDLTGNLMRSIVG